MATELAPIAFFAYKRADLAKSALESLRSCRLADRSYLRIYCDGAKTDRDREKVAEVRALVRREKWCSRVEIVERTENQGLSKSIRAGVSDLCREFGRVIVLEDDLVLHPSFLEYMNEGLDRYASDRRVMEISGYNYPVKIRNDADAFFICHASCWGWGTWKRAWDEFDDSPALYERLRSDPALRKKFDLDDSYPYFDLLSKQRAGEVDSWGIYWYQSLFAHHGLVLMPNQTLVCNRGAGELGTHQKSDGYPDVMSETEVRNFPPVSENLGASEEIARYLRRFSKRSFFARPPFSWIRAMLK